MLIHAGLLAEVSGSELLACQFIFLRRLGWPKLSGVLVSILAFHRGQRIFG
jgi:hypothetical protein